MKETRIFKSTAEEIKKIIGIQGDFTAKVKEPESISGYGNISWALKEVRISTSDGVVYIDYPVRNEWGRYYEPLSSSYAIYPDLGIIRETSNVFNTDDDEYEEYDMMHVSNPSEERWGSPWHAMAVYEEIFGDFSEPEYDQKYEVYSNTARGMIDVSDDVVEMTSEEFERICENKETPEFVHLTDTDTDKLYYNDHTCLNGYDGTCRCLSHPRKHWTKWSMKRKCWL